MAEPAYQSLYRRYRPQRFDEVRGQDHVTGALRNAVRDGRVAHAYLFSGPRGTGKTSTARILAKALNCTDLQDGEPCCKCESCLSAQMGASVDVFELDAASNRGIDSIRDLIAGANLGTPGERKVYIVDEVHMLSKDASTALLKTLEEPPAHVVFVLATTDAQKVLDTIQSRTQHFQFRLLNPETLSSLLKDVNDDAHLGIPPEAIDLVVRRGRGSARDALSVLDQFAAAGDVDEDESDADEIVEALCDADAGRALTAVAEAMGRGRDPRVLCTELMEHLRNAFLTLMAPGVVALPDVAKERATDHGRRLGPAALVRHLDLVGDAIVDMREAHDPRVSLEVALVRATRPEADTDTAALAERVAKLERAMSGGGLAAPARPAATETAPQAPPAASKPAARSSIPSRPPGAQPRPKAVEAEPEPAVAPPPANAAPAPVSTPAEGAVPDRDQLTQAWGDVILANLPPKAKSRLRTGRFTGVEGDTALFALPNKVHVDKGEEVRADAENALGAHFGTRVRLKLVVDDGGTPPAGRTAPASTPSAPTAPVDEVEEIDIAETVEASSASPEEVVLSAFPGAEEVEGQ
jgi:DNA polymerase III subunit gamma/tau